MTSSTRSNYRWLDAAQTSIGAVDSETGSISFSADSDNPYYRELLESGETPAEYVEPPASPELTAEEKLANAGLTVEELRTLLDL